MRIKHFKVFRSSFIVRNAVLMLVAASLASTASAMSLRELRILEKTSKQGSHYADYYLVGVMEGSVEALSQAVRKGATPILCLNGRRMEPRTARSLYDAELKRNEDLYEADMPVQLVMVNALTNIYACSD
jgi:type II secretory pathway component PulK